MNDEINNYYTSYFILKDDGAVAYIEQLCASVNNGENLLFGTKTDNSICSMIKHKSVDLAFMIKITGFLNFDADLIIKNELDDNLQEESSISLWEEVQNNLAENTWFFVDECSFTDIKLKTSVSFYHQDGRREFSTSFDIKKEIIDKLNL